APDAALRHARHAREGRRRDHAHVADESLQLLLRGEGDGRRAAAGVQDVLGGQGLRGADAQLQPVRRERVLRAMKRAHRAHRASAIVLAASLFASFVPAPLRAEPDAQVEEAHRHFQQGLKLVEEQDYRAALIEFKRAYELSPRWAVLYN